MARLENIDYLVQNGGTITIGRAGPAACAAIANDHDQMFAALVRRRHESLIALLGRLDRALKAAWENEERTDEINEVR